MAERLRKLFDETDIRKAVKRIARAILRDFDGEEILFVPILKGSFIFASDLVREMESPVIIDFIRAASYGCATATCGEVALTKDLETDITGKNVIIVEDVIDSGLTLRSIRDMLLARNPRSSRSARSWTRGRGGRSRSKVITWVSPSTMTLSWDTASIMQSGTGTSPRFS